MQKEGGSGDFRARALQTLVNGLTAENMEMKSRMAKMELENTDLKERFKKLESIVKILEEKTQEEHST